MQSVQRAVGTALAQTYAAYTYSSNGLPTTLTDAKGNRSTYEYDGHDRRVKLRYPHPTTAGTSSTTDYEQFTFDAAGNMLTHRKRSGESVSFAYDNLNRLLTRNYPTSADNVAFTYDLLGRRTQSKYANNSHTVSYVWDGAGRMSSTTSGTKTLAYQYDPAGNRTQLSWPEGGFYVTTSFDALNRPTAIKELGSTNLATYAWDDLSRRTTVTLGNGTTTSYGYSTQGALASLAHNLAGTAQDQSTTYTRNQVQEIVGHSWTNDLYQWAGYANGTKSYTANGLNQYTVAAGATISHDTRGNLTGDGTWTYSFDADNKLKSATKSGYSATLGYDPEGRLHTTVLAGTTTHLRYDGADLVAEYDGSGNLLRRYVHGPGVDEALVWYEGSTTTNKTWLYADHLGSVTATANSAGTSTATYSYGPYGEPNVTTGVRFRYTGQQYIGGLNLYYYKARFYSPAIGRFLQTDPIGTADDLNLYAYVGNNPVNFSDPTGLVAAEAKMLGGKISDWGRQNGTAILDGTQTVLDVGGLVPGFGEIADGANALIYLARGDRMNAGLSAAAMIPFAGWTATSGKLAAKGEAAFFRGAKAGEAPSFVPRPNDFKVDPKTGFVKDTHGVSVFDNPLSVSSKGYVPHRVEQSSIPDSLRIIQRGSDPRHFEIVPRPGANLTPQQFINACSSIVCAR